MRYSGIVVTIYDPIDSDAPTTWFPGNAETSLLVAALTASGDVSRSLDGLSADPLADRRGLSMLATPAMSLLDNTISLQKAMSNKDTSSWPPGDANLLVELGRSLRKTRSGPLGKLRNQLSAHHDASALGAEAASIAVHAPLVLEAVAQSLCVLVLLLNHQNVFAWSRQASSERPDVVQIFQPGALGVPSFRHEGGEIVELLKFTMRADPKDEAQDIVAATLERYNRVAERAHLRIVVLTTSDVLPRGHRTG
jgi:hypothetical protein